MPTHPFARITAIIFLFSSSIIYGQRYNFKFYGEEEGLRSLAVQVVLQDRAGFLWVGTQNGLFRYDGNRFAGFGKADGLPDAHIESLHESRDGTLWVGTRFGLARRRSRAQPDRFEKIPLGGAIGIVGREGIASDAVGNLYVATEQGLVAGTPGKDGPRFTLIPNPPQATPPVASSVFVDSGGVVWFGCGTTLCTINHGQARESGTELGLPQQRWDAILADLEGNLWVRSEKLLYKRAPGGHFLAQPGLQDSTNTYPTLTLDPAGRLLVPTCEGLARQTANGGWAIVRAKDGLSTNDISAVMKDREGSIWIGLLGSGLARWLGYNEWQIWTDEEGLSRESTWSIKRDATGRLWVGTESGLNYAEPSGEKLTWRQQSLPSGGYIRTLAPASDGTLWIGTDPGGLLALNPKTGSVRKIGEEQGLNNTRLRHVAVDKQGRVWAATYQGLYRSEPGNSGRFEQVTPPGTGAGEMFHMTVVDREGTVWVAGDRGLARFAGEKWMRFTKKDGLADDKIAQVAEDTDGSLWIGYRDAFGITHIRFPNGEQKIDSYTQANGLRSDKILFLQIDARGWLWVGTDHGVDVFDRSRWRHYGRSDGLVWDDCNSNAFFADTDGAVWVGTSRGLSRFKPAANAAPSVPPPVVLTSVKLGDKTVDPSTVLRMPYQENSLQVRFAALTFVQQSSVLFRYRLDGVKSDWLETTERELNYPKLPPGQYTLEVRARNAQGLWSEEPARLSFQVLAPWWLTWWFQVGSGVLALLLGRLMWQRRTSRLEAQRDRLEKAVMKRTLELSQEKQRVLEEKARVEQQNREIERLLTEAQQASRLKSEFLANMSHEIRTPMNGILGMTDLVLTTPLTDEQRDYLDTARLSASSLLTILNDVLDFSKIEANRLDLNPIQFSLRRRVGEACKMMRVGANEKGLVLELEIADSVPDHLVGDPDRLQQVLYNIIGNAIKFTGKGGVYLNIAEEPAAEAGALLRFTIRDTGIGIPQEKQRLIFEAFRQADGSTTRKYGGTGLGLAISSSLVEMMGGSIHVESEPRKGSTFSFTARFQVAELIAGGQPVDSANLKNLLDGTGLNGETTRLRILLAEDNPVNQRLAIRLLERRGHHVDLASTGREAIAFAELERFDLILMDLQMPDMDGIEATAVIREREKHRGGRTPIVALTAHSMKGDRERCLEAGMDNYINKPIDAAKFLEIVEMTAAALASD
jgi:signal transduction histidine kinase/streptogramin lyase/ActR/RegA family two-component response regulator